MNFKVKPNFKVVGKILGSKIKDFENALNNLSEEDINKLNNNLDIKVNLNNEEFNVNKDYVDIRITSKEGFNVGMDNNNFIILNTELTNDLLLEGIAREIVSKVQNMRKIENFDVSDRITIDYNGEYLKEAIKEFKDYIQNETLALEINYNENINNKVDINGNEVNIVIKKVVA